MPSCGRFEHFWEYDPRRWACCLKTAGDEMVAKGWNPQARKFDGVRRKRAMKLWNSK